MAWLRKKRLEYWKDKSKEWRKNHPNYHTEYMREYRKTSKYKSYLRKYRKIYRKNNPHIKKTNKVARKISMKTFCEICKSNKYLIRHHEDYSKPKIFITLCKKCHRKIHNY